MDDYIAYVILAFYAAAVIVCGLKGKWWFVILSFFIPVFLLAAIIGSFRLAKPTSIWARHFYDDEQLDLAVRRFTTDEEYAEFTEARMAKNHAQVGGSSDEIGEIAPPIN